MGIKRYIKYLVILSAFEIGGAMFIRYNASNNIEKNHYYKNNMKKISVPTKSAQKETVTDNLGATSTANKSNTNEYLEDSESNNSVFGNDNGAEDLIREEDIPGEDINLATKLPEATPKITKDADPIQTALIPTQEIQETDNLGVSSYSGSYSHKNRSVIVKKSDTVEQSYFGDALFVGDGRMLSFCNFSGINTGTFYVGTGLSIHNIDIKTIEFDGNDTYIYDAIGRNHFGKVYISMGSNDLNSESEEVFKTAYSEMVKRIQQLQPGTIIYLQSILYVTKEKSDESKVFHNKKIEKYNKLIKSLADGKTIYYLDLNSGLCKKNEKELPKNSSSDGINLNPEYCVKWLDFLKCHVVKVK